MKILWLCNIMLPAIAEKLGLSYSNREGWLTGIYERISPENTITLGICFPTEHVAEAMGTNGKVQLGSVTAYAFSENLSEPEHYEEKLEARFKAIIADFAPDMVHIFGTEFPHTLAMVRAYGKPKQTLIGIQGLCFVCADFYMADVPAQIQERVTFRDWLKKDSMLQQQEKFRVRGENEREALKLTGHITGRTDFDRLETGRVNAGAEYHFMNETMRSPFYTGSWEMQKCLPYSIFLSQGDYPLKGFHYVLQAMPQILSEYPEACIFVAGSSIIENRTIKDKLKLSSYGKYLRELIEKNHLEEKVKILGRLSAEEMKIQFLKSSVFVCPSSLENSPNSMGEAMLLGVPVVAAGTGGIPSMIADGKEGILYQPGNVGQLAESIKNVWREPEKTVERAKAARRRAAEAHDADRNYERLLEIYREICI